MINNVDRIICPKCKFVAIKLVAINDNGSGKKVCRKCKKKIRSEPVKFELLGEEKKMVMKNQLKISEFSMDRLRVYALNYNLKIPGGFSEAEERAFYIVELQKLNDGKDDVGSKVDAGKYKGVNSCECSKCGETKAVRAEVYAKRVEKFGSEEKLKESYLCMDCRRKEK